MDRDSAEAHWRSSAAIRPMPELSAEQWARVKEVFYAAVERPRLERSAFIRDISGDTAVASAVERLLTGDDDAQSFMETPAAALVGQPAPPESAALTVGQQFGAYTIVAPIGAGGMGEVYRAHDTKLGRDVAVKVLPTSLASHPERLARFDREARVLATLNHPNIATIHGIEDVPADTGRHIRAIVMELIDGDTLAQRLQRGPIPRADALAIARQIADALDAAHEKAIVHRDLKPANIAITRDNLVKVLDFGLAKAVSGDGATADLTQSPTVTVGGTREGVILGTAAYMSPEQARGRAVDKRTDIWAFGCVLYEMLTGRVAFAAETVSDTIAAILQTEPEWTAVIRDSPHVWRLLIRCLEKDPKRRLRDIGEALFQLEEGGRVAPQAAARKTSTHATLAWASAGVLAVAVGVLLSFVLGAGESVTPESRLDMLLPSGDSLQAGSADSPLAVSADGKRVAYVAERNGQGRLYVRELSDLVPKALPGTENARHPFFSSDGNSVAFFANKALYKVAVAGGAPLRLCNVATLSKGGSWADRTIVFASLGSDLQRLDEDGGTPTPLKGTNSAGPAAWPEILPDGKTVLFTIGGGGFAVAPLNGGPMRVVARSAESRLEGPAVLGAGGYLVQARYVANGYLVYGQHPGNVQAIAFDLASRSVRGSPVSMVDSVERARNAGGVYFGVSQTGLLVYAPTGERHQLVWVDPKTGVSTPISEDRAAFRNPRLSPDDSQIVVGVSDDLRSSNIRIYDARRGAGQPLTDDKRHNLNALWNPDGAHVTFSPSGPIVEIASTGGARNVLVPFQGHALYPTSWSQDGQRLLYSKDTEKGYELWVASWAPRIAPRLPLAGPGQPPSVTEHKQLASRGEGGVFSPDGQWVAYEASEAGRIEVYVAHFPDFAAQVRISTGGGTRPQWSRNGRELFYRQGNDLMAVEVTLGNKVSPGQPRRLFTGDYSGESRESSFDVAKDGRFLMVKSDEAATLRQLVVVQNWFEELKRRAPVPAK